jgi:hypothetical protein
MALDRIEDRLALFLIVRSQHRAEHRLEQGGTYSFAKLRDLELLVRMASEQVSGVGDTVWHLTCRCDSFPVGAHRRFRVEGLVDHFIHDVRG